MLPALDKEESDAAGDVDLLQALKLVAVVRVQSPARLVLGALGIEGYEPPADAPIVVGRSLPGHGGEFLAGLARSPHPGDPVVLDPDLVSIPIQVVGESKKGLERGPNALRFCASMSCHQLLLIFHFN